MLPAFLEMMKPLYGVDTLEGYTEEEIQALKKMFSALPQVLEDYYRAAGRTDAFHHVQDSWILPENFQQWEWLQQSEYMILLNENQGVCRAGIRRADLCLPDPPVYTTDDDENWIPCAPAVSEFLPAALAYESVFTFEYYPEDFFWLTENEMDAIDSQLTKLPFELTSWVGGMKISLYHNAPDNMVAVMGCDGEDLQMLYGAASEASYEKLLTVLEDIGEPM